MADTILGIDIGTWSIKTVEIDPRDGSIVAFEEVRLPLPADEPVETAAAPVAPPAPDAGATGGPPPVPHGGDEFEDEPTQVREAPAAPENADEPVEEVEPVAQEPEFDEPWRIAVEGLPNLESARTAERLVAAMPDGATTTLRVRVPFEEPSKVKNILPHLLDDRLPMPLSSVIWAFRVMPAIDLEADDETPFEALVVVCPRVELGAQLAALAEHRLDPSQLLVAELGLAALAESVWREGDGTFAMLDIGHETTNLIVLHNGEIAAARSIKTAGRKLTDSIAKAFNVDVTEAERLKHEYASILDGEAPNQQMAELSRAITDGLRPVVRDVRRTLQSTYARDRIEVSAVYITGGTSTIPGLERHLSNQLGVEVSRVSPEGIASAGNAIPRAGMPWALARIGADEQLRNRALNLRREEFSYRGRSSYIRAQFLKFGAVAAMMLLLIVVLLFAQKASQEAQRDAMRAALRTQTKELFGEPVTKEKDIKLRLEGEGTGAGSLVPARSAYELTYEVVTRISGDLDLELTRLEVDVDRNLIQIRGDTTDAQAVDRLVTDLEKLECLKEIKKDKLTVKGERADFELQINSGCS